MNPFRISAMAFGLLVAVTACGSDDSGSSATDAPTSAASTSVAPASTAEVTTVASTAAGASAPTGAGDTVDISDFMFAPAMLEVAVGSTVTWTNSHTQAHTANSAGNFDTGAIQPGASATVTFDETGTFSYICSFHPFMTGTIAVA